MKAIRLVAKGSDAAEEAAVAAGVGSTIERRGVTEQRREPRADRREWERSRTGDDDMDHPRWQEWGNGFWAIPNRPFLEWGMLLLLLSRAVNVSELRYTIKLFIPVTGK